MTETPKLARVDIIGNGAVIGSILTILITFSVFFSQDWGLSAIIIMVPSICGFLGLFFTIMKLLKPHMSLKDVAVIQSPLGDEDFQGNVFQAGFMITMVLLITLGYESLLSPAFIDTTYDILFLLVMFAYVTCFHVSINKMWIEACIKVKVTVPPDAASMSEFKNFPEYCPEPSVKTYKIWSPTQNRYEKLSIINILLFITMLVAVILDTVSQVKLLSIPLPLPGLNQDDIPTSLSALVLAIIVIEPVFFGIVSIRVFRETMGYDVNDLAPILVKIEKDDTKREKIIRYLEKVQEWWHSGI
nr:hypothetical protein [Candidatus Sigynarchaeota archaeon]